MSRSLLFSPIELIAAAALATSVLLGAGQAPPSAAAPLPASAGGAVDTVVTIRAMGSALEYETTDIELEAGTTVTIRLDNSASSMPHNVVLLTAHDQIRTVGIAALSAQQTEYVPAGEADKIIAHTALASPGTVVEMTFEVPPPGEYPYICTYPGHFQTMRGTLTSVERSSPTP